MYARKNRSFKGTVSLWLLLALVVAANPITTAKALAAGEISNASLPPVGTGLYVSPSRQVKIPLTIVPATDFGAGTVNVLLRFRKGASVLNRETTAHFVYADIYSDHVVDIVYSLPADFGADGVKLGSGSTTQVIGTTISLVVYLDEVTPSEGEEEAPPPGGQIGGTTGTDTGWQSYNPATDTSTVYVDPDKTQELFAAAPPAGVVLVEPPAVGAGGTVPSNVNASLPLTVVSQAGGASVSSVLQMGSVELVLSPQVMQALAQSLSSAAGPIASLKVKVHTETEQATDDTLKSTGGDLAGLTPASRVVVVTFVAVDAAGRETVLSVDRSSISVSFNPQVVKDPEKVNLYIIGSLIYVGGKVDLAKNTVTADLTKLKDAKLVALEYDKTFADITGHWAQDDVELMASKYVVKGMTGTEFQPDSQVTRAQFVTLLTRSLGLIEEKPSKATFGDVAPASWYFGYVEAAFKAGLAMGDNGTGGLFRPEDTVSREEMAALLVRAMKQSGKPGKDVTAGEVVTLLGRFTDSASVSSWAKTEVSQAVNEGLIKGRPDGQFDPIGSGSRAEGATMMSRFMKQVGKI